MKKLLSSVGMLALGTAGLQAAYAPGLSSMETSKPWSVSASLRGFYDDNYTTSPSATAPESFGFEVSPSASLNLPMDQTFIGLSYIYSMKYFEDRVNNTADHSHQFKGKLDHAFSERYKLELDDSFVIAQEPAILNPTGFGLASFLRINGNNMRNYGTARLTSQLSPLLSAQLEYENTLYDYESTGPGSYSALLDRMEHVAAGSLRYQALPQTVVSLTYQYALARYTSKDPVIGVLQSSLRNTRSHYAHIGADHNFNSQLNGSIRVGARFTDFYNQGVDDVSPYADANLTYAYAAGNSVQLGVRHDRNATDRVDPGASTLTLDQESTSAYVSLTHRLTSKITANLLGQYQHSTFQGGALNDLAENFLVFGSSLSYRINPHWMAEAGYNFDRLDSDAPAFGGTRSYSRNRIFIGVRATY